MVFPVLLYLGGFSATLLNAGTIWVTLNDRKIIQDSAECLPWIKSNKIIIATGECEKIRPVQAEKHGLFGLNPHADKAGPRSPKDPRPVTPRLPKLNKILPFDGCNAAGTLTSWSVSVAFELGSV